MGAPHEIIVAPLTIWLAPLATAFPDIDEAPAVAWKKLGTVGDKSYEDGGVSVTHGQTIETFTPAGSTRPRKAYRTEEGFSLDVTLVDLTPEQYARVMNDATVTDTPAGAGVAGTQEFDIGLGLDVATFALLARGVSSVDNDLVAQYEAPIVYQGGEPNPVFSKGAPAGLACSFIGLDHDTDGFGRYVVQDAEPTS